MRRLHDLDQEIARVEARLARRRAALVQNLTAVRASARLFVSSPVMLGAAFVAGFLLERISGSRRRHAPELAHKAGAAGIAAALAMALTRAALSSASVWAGPLFRRWVERRRTHAQPSWAERDVPPVRPIGPRAGSVEDRRKTLH